MQTSNIKFWLYGLWIVFDFDQEVPFKTTSIQLDEVLIKFDKYLDSFNQAL